MNAKKKEYFSANKAREICDRINNRPQWIIELEDILSVIEVSAKEGKDSISEFIQYEATKNKLIELGYKVSLHYPSRMELRPFLPMDYLKISW
jgi:hypothetical protein